MKLAIEILKKEIAQRQLAQKHNHLRKDEIKLELKLLNKAFVVLDKYASTQARTNIEKLDKELNWVNWLEKSPSHALNEESNSRAIRDIYQKLNEVVISLNTL